MWSPCLCFVFPRRNHNKGPWAERTRHSLCRRELGTLHVGQHKQARMRVSSKSRASLLAEVLQHTCMLNAVGGPCCPRRSSRFNLSFNNASTEVKNATPMAAAPARAWPRLIWRFVSNPPQTWRRHHVTSAANSWDASRHSRHARKHLHATQQSTTSLRRAAGCRLPGSRLDAFRMLSSEQVLSAQTGFCAEWRP